jgi:sulfofructosephosphate aldolase
MPAARVIPDKIRPLMKQGGMTMLALDQRGSLRTIVASGRDEGEVSDQQLSEFKSAAAEVLSPLASAVLLDSGLGRQAMSRIAPGVPLILSADTFEQRAGGPVTKSTLDPVVTPALVEELGATAIKLLIIWNEGSDEEFRRDVVGRFVELARKTGRIALVEGIVRDKNGQRYTTAREHGEAVIAAARELVAPGPDVYKAEVPGYLPGQLGEVTAFAQKLTAEISQPWVVLSNGVEAKDFAEAVKLSCAGGASGFLAGRAIWADAASRLNPRAELQRESLPRLRNLVDIVRTQAAHTTRA